MVHNLGHLTVIGYLRSLLVADLVVLLQELLQVLVGLDVVLLEAKDLKRLHLGDKATLYTEPLLGYLLAALIGEFLGQGLL